MKLREGYFLAQLADSRSPSWGAWIEMHMTQAQPAPLRRRSPSWGAWIEILASPIITLSCLGRSPSWGAWIEILVVRVHFLRVIVAPPRGERGLKCPCPCPCGRRICVAPPRGERGLKWRRRLLSTALTRRSPSWGAWIEIRDCESVIMNNISRSPSWGAWIEIYQTTSACSIN